MEIDTPATASSSSAASAPPLEKQIKIHPLAIITISDHHTRIISGGSALPPSSPVIGLLFGHRHDNTISVVDAEEMDPTATSNNDDPSGEGGSNESIRRKIELHRKVFSRHDVVGWYRVNKEGSAEPTQDDLRRNQLEISQYCADPLFLVMNAASSEYTGEKKPSADDQVLDDDQLPLMVYETVALDSQERGSRNNAVFINVQFELETYEPERIAVEKVFKTAPSKSASVSSNVEDSANNSKTEETRKVKKSKKEETASKPPEPMIARPPSELDAQLDSLQSSIRAMNARMKVLLEFLRKVEKGELPRDDALLRSVDGLLQQLPLVYAALEEGVMASRASTGDLGGDDKRRPLRELESDYNDTMLLSYLAAVAKTAKTVHVYTEKYRGAFETNSSLRDISGRRTGY
ncbi:hypothetical protein HJC23_009872 [Cyclotella cryptica]|uniref:COP9 signalosome complex subunit 6 n=1 Tax=Cyclotella cryptica TaxID=29204 RepID=A0ABD3QAZ4_9STRA|eukprot:CCRYP_006977-RA/>CCRYP_006977-RA protein AED:0.03 eAED:0.02 QI:0/-1/0/1/-1/1/1/0/405